jgi:hypothetical protein
MDRRLIGWTGSYSFRLEGRGREGVAAIQMELVSIIICCWKPEGGLPPTLTSIHTWCSGTSLPQHASALAFQQPVAPLVLHGRSSSVRCIQWQRCQLLPRLSGRWHCVSPLLRPSLPFLTTWRVHFAPVVFVPATRWPCGDWGEIVACSVWFLDHCPHHPFLVEQMSGKLHNATFADWRTEPTSIVAIAAHYMVLSAGADDPVSWW